MNNLLTSLLLIGLMASIEDSFNLQFDVLWIIMASSIFIVSDKSLLFLLIGLLFVVISPLDGIIGSGDMFFISLLTPFAVDYLLWIYTAAFMAILTGVICQNKVIPFLFPVIIGFTTQIFLGSNVVI